MSESHPPGVWYQRWLEDELYQEYLGPMPKGSMKAGRRSLNRPARGSACGNAVHASHPVSVLDREVTETLPIPIPEKKNRIKHLFAARRDPFARSFRAYRRKHERQP